MTSPPEIRPALLTRTEIEWLQGKVSLSQGYCRKIKSDIRKKIIIFQELELPLLVKFGFISSNAATAICNAATTNCNSLKLNSPVQANPSNYSEYSNFIVGRKGLGTNLLLNIGSEIS